MKRRDFLKSSALASSALMVPSFLSGFQSNRLLGGQPGKKLVVVQLSGGNDGLNTIVPYRNDLYYQNRPTLALKDSEVLRVSDDLGFNPALQSLRELYDDGFVSILNNVGYPNPDRSHFRSMDIWHSASDSTDYLNTGWIGRYLDTLCEGCDKPYHALEVDDGLSLALKGHSRNGFAVSDIPQLKRTTDSQVLQAVGKYGASTLHHEEENVAYLYKVMADTQASAGYLHQQLQTHRSKANYPQTPFGKDLKQIADLMCADSEVRIYYVSLTGFDTHANQKPQQERLLRQYADGMKAFVQDLKSNNLMQETLIMTFSEFGRRVKQNGSGGSDHGAANNLFLLGGSLKKAGFYNNAPDLSQLDDGDLKFDTDFRQIYATVLSRWLEADAGAILGQSFAPLAFV
ncbi:MAG: DUF1501 domain-containing protein [Saprospiraceae bacterium]|nr:DUF1501 domain-containing protein [Saprospiraceae bacterium]